MMRSRRLPFYRPRLHSGIRDNLLIDSWLITLGRDRERDEGLGGEDRFEGRWLFILCTCLYAEEYLRKKDWEFNIHARDGTIMS